MFPEAKLVRAYQAMGFSDVSHPVGHPNGEEPQKVGWYSDWSILARGKGVTTLQMVG